MNAYNTHFKTDNLKNYALYLNCFSQKEKADEKVHMTHDTSQVIIITNNIRYSEMPL